MVNDLWKDELSDEQADALIDKLVHQVKSRKMEAPAIMMLEMHKPLAYIGTQTAVALSPFLIPFVGFQNVNDYTRLFAKRANVEKLIRRLESDGPDKPEEPTPGETNS